MQREHHVTTRWSHPELGAWDIGLAFAVVNQRLECIGVDLRSVPDGASPAGDHASLQRPITALLMRAIPWIRIVESERRALLSGDGPFDGLEAPDPRSRQAAEKWHATVGRSGRRPRYGPEHFEEVARVYSDAWQRREAPTKAVAEHWTVSKSTAAKWVARTRDLGLLGPTRRGKAGGVVYRELGLTLRVRGHISGHDALRTGEQSAGDPDNTKETE